MGKPAPRLVIPRWLIEPLALAVDAYNAVSGRTPVLIGHQVRLSGLDFYIDSSKAVRELGYPILPFRDAAVKTYEWYREHGYLT